MAYTAADRASGTDIYDMFDALGLVRADKINTNVNKDAKTLSVDENGNKNIGAKYLEIRFVESGLFNSDRKGRTIISLPFHHDKSVSDRLQAKIENQWGSTDNPLMRVVGNLVQSSTTGGGDWGSYMNGVGEFLKTAALFKYDAGSAKKTLSIPFIAPLASASKSALYSSAAMKMRNIFNALEGMLYPQGSGFFMPPLMELTLGGMYRSFFGFITAVDIMPSNNEMFQDPCTGQYFNMVYEGTITFDNLFLYYHKGGSGGLWDVDIQGTKAVLFGEQNLEGFDFYKKFSIASGQNANATNVNGVYYFSENENSRANVSLLYQGENSLKIEITDPRARFNQSSISDYSLYLPSIWQNDTAIRNGIQELMFYTTNSENMRTQIKNFNTRITNITTIMLRNNPGAYTLDQIKNLDTYRNSVLALIQEKKSAFNQRS